MSKYDLLITGGRVLDPANELDEVCDIAISDGYIEKVQKEIDPSFGKSVEDWTGNWIIPGFIDTHVHVGGPRSELEWSRPGQLSARPLSAALAHRTTP